MSTTAQPSSFAWEPLTPRGVAAFARASWGRLWLAQLIVALLAGAVTTWFLYEEWLPVVYEIAGPLLESASHTGEPPTVVEQAQTAISWLSRVLVELDQDSPETPTALTETLARLLTVWVFTELARERHRADHR